MQVDALAAIVARLPEQLPISAAYERKRAESRQSRVWYSNQREHWLAWLDGYHTAGAYGRKPNGAHDAARVWARLQCVGMLVWLAEAASVNRQSLLTALEAALAPGLHNSRRCGQFRAHVTWPEIERALS